MASQPVFRKIESILDFYEKFGAGDI